MKLLFLSLYNKLIAQLKCFCWVITVFNLIFIDSTVTAQTQISPKYSVDGDVNALASFGDTLIVGGNFSNAGVYTGGSALFTTTSDQPNLNFPKIIGTIYASTPDGAGGYYIYGRFKKETEATSHSLDKRIEHVLPDYSYENGFSLPVSVQFDVNKLLYHNGLLYVGGSYVDQINDQAAGDLAAINVATKQVVSWIPAITRNNLGGIYGLYITQNTLYITGGFTDVGGVPRRNIAAIELYTGNIKTWNFGANFPDAQNYNDIKFYKNKLVIGGGFHDTQFKEHACALVDTINGLSFKYLFTSGGLFGNGINNLYFAAQVISLAISGDTLFTFSYGTFDTRVTALNLADSNRVLWAKYFNMIASATKMEVTDGGLYVGGGNFSDIYSTNITNDYPINIERKIKGIVKLNTATGDFVNWLADPIEGRTVWTISLQGNNLFIGGDFSHVNSFKRTEFVMIKASTQQILPFNVNLSYSTVNAFKIIGNILYAAGEFNYLNGVDQLKSVLAFNLTTGDLLPWNPPYLGYAFSIEANTQYVFLGGNLHEPTGATNRINLFAIDRQSATLSSWTPNPNQEVKALNLSEGKLYVGGAFANIAGTARVGAASFDTADFNLTNWNPDPKGQVNTIQSTEGTIWIGGGFFSVGGISCNGLAGVHPLLGTLLHVPIPNFIFGFVNAITIKGCYVIFGSDFRINNTNACNDLFVYDMYSKSLLSSSSFCQNIDDLGGKIKALTTIGNDLYFSGSFTKVNGKANATNIDRVQFPLGYFNGCTEYISAQNGNWHTPSTWQGNSVPPVNAKIRISHAIILTQSTNCFSLHIEPGGIVTLSNGVEIKVVN